MTGSARPAFTDVPVRRFGVWLGAVTAAGLLLRLIGLPGQVIFADDRLVAKSAVAFVERARIGPTMWHHPHLRDVLVYPWIAAGGSSKMALVAWSLALGAGLAPLVGLLGRRLSGRWSIGLLAALLVACEPIHVDFSRQAVHEIYMATFAALGVWLALRHAERGRIGPLLGAGIAFGLGLASKWIVAAPAAVTLAWLVWSARRDAARLGGPGPRLLTALRVSALLLIPLLVYLVTFLPWLAGGNDLADLWRLHAAMLRENAVHLGGNPAVTIHTGRAALWFLMPVVWTDFAMGASGPVILAGFTQPLLWLLGVPAIVLLARRAIAERSEPRALLGALLFATWLPFALSPRPIYANSSLVVLPFVAIAVAWLVVEVGDRLRRPRLPLAYAVSVLVVAAPLEVLALGYASRAAMFRPVIELLRPPPDLELPDDART
jgi:dolichyl-phosphate-mannose--protein O-mannosyl transferase